MRFTAIRSHPVERKLDPDQTIEKKNAPGPALFKPDLFASFLKKKRPAIRYFVHRYCGFHLNGTPQDLDASAAAASFTAATISETVRSKPTYILLFFYYPPV